MAFLLFSPGAAVVDTSANYMGGNSELLVGEGVDRWRASGDGDGKSLTVVSKFGYASVRVHRLWCIFWMAIRVRPEYRAVPVTCLCGALGSHRFAIPVCLLVTSLISANVSETQPPPLVCRIPPFVLQLDCASSVTSPETCTGRYLCTSGRCFLPRLHLLTPALQHSTALSRTAHSA